MRRLRQVPTYIYQGLKKQRIRRIDGVTNNTLHANSTIDAAFVKSEVRIERWYSQHFSGKFMKC